jgi:glycerol dehydrogenase
MTTAIRFPGRYVQGAGALAEAGACLALLGRRPLICWGRRSREAAHAALSASLDKAGIAWSEELFGGECTKAEAQRLAAAAQAVGADAVAGVGGGKVIDAAKAAAALAGLRTIAIPTIASSDAPTSACTVWYNDAGASVGVDFWKTGPDLVLVDTGVIARAPPRFLAAGIGDALATWPEADAAARAGAAACAGGAPTRTALALARLCYDTLLAHALDARAAVAAGRVTPAVEAVVEAGVLLSGVGWESGGLAGAHAVANALPALPETRDRLHGEKVAFGLVVQLCLEPDRDAAERQRIVDLLVALNLPVTFAELGLADLPEARLRSFARRVAIAGSSVHNHPFKVTADSVAAALLAADALGRSRKTA